MNENDQNKFIVWGVAALFGYLVIHSLMPYFAWAVAAAILYFIHLQINRK